MLVKGATGINDQSNWFQEEEPVVCDERKLQGHNPKECSDILANGKQQVTQNSPQCNDTVSYDQQHLGPCTTYNVTENKCKYKSAGGTLGNDLRGVKNSPEEYDTAISREGSFTALGYGTFSGW